MIIAAVIIVIFVIVFLAPIKISVLCQDNRLKVKAGFFTPVITVFDTKKQKQKNKPEKNEKESGGTENSDTTEERKEENNPLERIKEIFEIVYDALKFLKKHLKFYEFTVKLTIGTNDAAQTAIATGAAWALMYNIAGIIDRTFLLKKHGIDVKPVYDNEIFYFFFSTEAGLGLIWALVMLAVLLKKLKKIR